MKPELVALALADAPERWSALGFEVVDCAVTLGGVTIALGAEGEGIVAWSVTGVNAGVDGLRSVSRPRGRDAEHPNTAIGLDHVVVLTDDFDRTAGALAAAGLGLRRTIERGERRMGFRRLGPAILELVQAPAPPHGTARFWGLTIVVEDLSALAARLGSQLGPIGPAVQPGRQIATLRESAGLTQPVAFMDPEKR
jgi:hypothetical protein